MCVYQYLEVLRILVSPDNTGDKAVCGNPLAWHNAWPVQHAMRDAHS